MKPLIAALIGCLVISSALAQSKKAVTAADCKDGERFTDCGTCEPTCGNESPICNRMCQGPMCICEVGKVRNPDGKCVLPSQCQPLNSTEPIVAPVNPELPTPVCQENEGVKHCSGCEPTCDTPNPFCTKICRQLNICECLPNFYRHNGTSRCVPAEQCPEGSAARTAVREPRDNGTQQCGVNEVLKQCSGCESQCGRPQIMCKMMCNNIPKCECDSGFFRDNRTNTCVPQAECSGPEVPIVPPVLPPGNATACGKNEALKSCPGCEPTCENQNPICPMICRLGQECQCKKGFVRNAQGKCVSPKKCPKGPKKCGANETLKSCPGCEPSCKNPNPVCIEICREGQACECSPGFVRNDAGKCVDQAECSGSTNNTINECGENERMNPCSGCEANCAFLDRMCVQMCNMIPKCECAPGFARNAQNKCVPTEQCNSIRNPRDNSTQTNKQCSTNEVLTSCPGCEPSCANKNPICTLACRLGQECQCAQGFYRNAQGKCVTENECDIANPPSNNSSSRCPLNEQYQECGGCESSCTEHNPICTLQCRPAGCYCPSSAGFVRNAQGKCVHKSQCNNGGSDDDEYNPCAATSCPVGSDCVKVQVQCIRAPCPPQARCVPQNSTRPSRSPPVLTNPCAAVFCAANTRCQVKTVQCLVAPCPQEAECVPLEDSSETTNPCATMLCAPNTQCQIKNKQCFAPPCPLEGECVPIDRPTRDVDDLQISDPCMTMKCTANTRCQAIPINCIKAPCPAKGQCVPITPEEPTPDTSLTCANIDCQADHHCEMQEVQCIRAPCPPIPTCVPNNDTRPSRSTDDILASDPCATIRCKSGMVCSKIMINCLRNSQGCRPRGVCVPADENGNPQVPRPSRSPNDDPCATIRCGEGMVCSKVMVNCLVLNENCAPHGICVPANSIEGQTGVVRPSRETPQGNEDPCAVIDCRSGMRCTVVMPSCIEGATDCGPRGVCINETDQPEIAVLPPVDPPQDNIQNNFCMVARCAGACITSGIKCNEDGSQCEYLGQCASRDEDLSNLDVCANSTCPTNKTCEAEKVQCFAPPCPPIPRCVEKHAEIDVCAKHSCPKDEECRPLRLRCNRMVPNCNPIPRCVKKQQQ